MECKRDNHYSPVHRWTCYFDPRRRTFGARLLTSCRGVWRFAACHWPDHRGHRNSLAEIAVSLQAAANGQVDLTLGNVLGSNIFNILFILGITSIVAPIVIAEQLIRKDAPIMLGVSLFTFALARDGNLNAIDGVILLLLLIAYTVFALKQSRSESREVQNEYAREFSQKESFTAKNNLTNVVFIVIGLGLLVWAQTCWWIPRSKLPSLLA